MKIFVGKKMAIRYDMPSASTISQFCFCDHKRENDLKLGTCCVSDLDILRPRLQNLISDLQN